MDLLSILLTIVALPFLVVIVATLVAFFIYLVVTIYNGIKDFFYWLQERDRMNQFDINIHRFANKFSDVYEFLYDHHDEVLGFVGAMEFGDWFIKNFPDFTRKFTDYRGDILTSDREVAAYGFVLMYMIGE